MEKNNIDNILIVSGGTINEEILKEFVEKKCPDYIIAVDGGLEVIDRLNIIPDYIVGDFDTVKNDVLRKYCDIDSKGNTLIKGKTKVRKYNPQKDMTDTQIALDYAIKLEPVMVNVFGATGTRLDHVLGNIALLKRTIDSKVQVFYYDVYNRIQITNSVVHISKVSQYGQYVSVIPYGGNATVSLNGFKYSLEQYNMKDNESLGVSNEVVEEMATVECHDGSVLIIESKDS